MKKLKLINSIMVASAIATPISFLSSCSEDNYAELAQMIKDDQVTIFKQLSKYHRATFDEGEAFEFIKSELSDKDTYGTTKKGEDIWSSLDCVKDQAQKDIEYKTKRFSRETFGNVWYDIEPTKGYENKPKILLHSHVDMTMAWNSKEIENHRWMNPADPAKGEDQGGVIVNTDKYVEEGEIFSDGTTSLGADNGMGVALMMSLAKHRHDFKHPGIRLLFTADESGAVPYYSSKSKGEHEPGTEVLKSDLDDKMLASGADLLTFDQKGLKFQEVRYNSADKKYYWGPKINTIQMEGAEKPFGNNLEYGNIISFDGSTKNTIYNSAAGIHECQMSNTFVPDADPVEPYTSPNKIVETLDSGELQGLKIFELTVSGLYGGHSGYDINKGLGNALQMLMQTLVTDDEQFRLISVESGDSAYQICKSASATFLINADRESDLKKRVATFWEIFASAYPNEDKINFSLNDEMPMPTSVKCFTHERSEQVVLFSDLLIYGPNTWYDKEHTEVKSSCNFGPLTIKENKDGNISFNYNIVARSAKEDELDVFQNLFHAAVEQILYDIIHVDKKEELVHIEDLVWERNDKVTNNLAEQVANGYKNINIKPSTVSSHAWLEIACFPSLFKDKVQGPDMICYGPEIEAAHTVDESIDTDTVEGMIKAVLYTFNHADRLKSYSN